MDSANMVYWDEDSILDQTNQKQIYKSIVGKKSRRKEEESVNVPNMYAVCYQLKTMSLVIIIINSV